ncbi:MAG: DoxX family protein [Bacteroidales bacterium]|nr:DoxX family protein [Bacteroidales bacterium]
MKTDFLGYRRYFAVVIGLVFFCAGLLKLMDPVGARLVVSEYFKFLGLGFLDSLSSFVGVSLAVLETLTGAALVTGVFRKIAAAVTAAFLGFFTLLTLALWIVNPEMDCGCFGEAIHLTHFQSFIKNVVLCILAVIAFVPFKDYGTPKKRKYVSFGLIAISSLLILLWCGTHIPFTDFTPFSLSSRLAAAQEYNEDGEDKFIATFIYEKNGQEGTFTLDDLPDSTWNFVRTETVLRQDNVVEKDHPTLSISDADGVYHDQLPAEDLAMVVSAHKPSAVSDRNWEKIADFLVSAEGNGFTSLLITPVSHRDVVAMLPATLTDEQRAAIVDNLYFSDFRTVISLNRSNGGVTYFNEGHLIQKWSARNMPSDSRLGKIRSHDETDLMLTASTKGRLSFQASFLYSFVVMFLI